MPQIPVYYAPNIDTGWSINPGACTALNQFAPTMRGTYGTVGGATYFSPALNSPPLIAYMFRQVNGTVRLLAFNVTSIDEYDSAGTRTSRATGFNASTTQWSAAANGNAIVACNYLDATQVSTGGAFAGLGGGSPKARFACAQSQFMLLADTDDGATPYADEVWWSALGNYASFTVSAATQAGRLRLLDTPGPIRAMIPLRDSVVVFKDDSIYVGQYVGPPVFWAWRLITGRIGTFAQHGVVEIGGVLYFPHTSGIYSFDGATITNIGRSVWQTILVAASYAKRGAFGGYASSAGSITPTQAIADDIEGSVVFLPVSGGSSASSVSRKTGWIYNTTSKLWGTFTLPATSPNAAVQNYGACVVKATHADIQAFLAQGDARFLFISSATGPTTNISYVGYPIASAITSPSLTTGMIGSIDKSALLSRITWRTLPGTDATAVASVSAAGYTTEDQNITNNSGTATGINTALDVGDVTTSAKYHTVTVNWTLGKIVELAAIGLEIDRGSKP